MKGGWFIYVYAIFLGTVSYIACFLSIRKNKVIRLDNFLFEGNGVLIAAFSIIGTAFSSGLFFTASPTLYILFGWILFPTALAASIMGILILKKKILKVFKAKPKKGKPIARISIERFKLLVESSAKPKIFYTVLFIYLFFMGAAEIASFDKIIGTLLVHDEWAPYILYIVIFSTVCYVFISGFRGVLITDTIQTIIIFLVSGVILYYVFSAPDFQWPEFSKIIVCPPNLGDALIFFVGLFIVCFSWYGTAPEVWVRLITLNTEEQGKKTINWSIFLLPIITGMPIVILIFFHYLPMYSGDSSAAFHAWRTIFSSIPQNSILAFFLILLTTAFFTTLDTFIITYSQLFKIVENEINPKLRKSLPKTRTFSIIYILLCLTVGIRLSITSYSIVGAYVASLPIFFFIQIYVYPYLRNNGKIQPDTIISHWVQLIALVPIIFYSHYLMGQEPIAHLSYFAIPFMFLGIELISLLISLIYSRKKGKK